MSISDTRSDGKAKKKTSQTAYDFSQHVHEKSMTAGFAIYAAVFVFLAAVLSTETILHFRASESASDKTSAALAFASELRARTDRELNSVLYLGSGVVGYLVVRHDQIDPGEINQILGAVYGYGRHVRNLSVAIGYRLSYVYPLAGNEQVIGRDYRDLKAQWPSVQRAVATRRVVLTGPVNLIQGGTGLIFRSPVFVGDNYWGMLSTVIDIPSLLKAAFSELDARHFEFAIRVEEEDGTGGGILSGSPALFADRTSVRLEAPMLTGKWVYAVRAAESGGGALTWAIRGMGWLLATLAGLSVFVVLRQRQELSRQAGFDSLTDLPNRRLFDDRLQQSIRRHARHGASQIAAVFLDLNDFKPINDRYGHKVGDMVLRVVAAHIREEVRVGDTVSRWAGDEFVLIIEDASEERVTRLIARLHQRIETPFDVDGITLTVSAAIGAAFYPDEAGSAADLLELADQRMYDYKTRQRNAGREG